MLTLIKSEKAEIVIKLISDYARMLKESFEVFVQIEQIKQTNSELSKLFMIGTIVPFYPVLMRVKKEENRLFNTLLQNITCFSFRTSLVRTKNNGQVELSKKLREAKDVSEIVNLTKTFTEKNWWHINDRANEALKSKRIYLTSGLILKYILFSYENSLRKLKGFPILGYKEYFAEEEREKLSIEHIAAKKAKDIEVDQDFQDNYLHNIGNLVIDCKASNSSKSNKNTEYKMSSYQAASLMPQNELDDITCNWQDLKSIKQFIDKREAKLKEYIKNEFGFISL